MTGKSVFTLMAIPSKIPPVNKVFDFIREAKEELYKVNWPARRDLIKLSAIVIVVSLMLGFGLGGVDYVLGQGVTLLIK